MLTYSDLMNNLLVMFIVLYTMSVIDLAKFEKLTNSFTSTMLGTSKQEIVLDYIPTPLPLLFPEEEATHTPEPSPTPVPNADQESILDEYDELVHKVTELLRIAGYDKQVIVEKIDEFIYLRFREGVFFYPDSPKLKNTAYPMLISISEIFMEAYDLIACIDISGHTARISKDPPSKENLFSWELSTNRALAVLKFLVQQCEVPQEKLSVTGNSCNQLYVEGDTEEFRAQNRRVEIRLTKASP